MAPHRPKTGPFDVVIGSGALTTGAADARHPDATCSRRPRPADRAGAGPHLVPDLAG